MVIQNNAVTAAQIAGSTPVRLHPAIHETPLTVGLGIFGAPESGVDWSIVSAATLLSVAPLLIAFLLFQRQFIQSFMHSGIK